MITPWTDTELDWDEEDSNRHYVQRSRRGFSDLDTIAMDQYLACIIGNYAELHIKKHKGYPCELETDEEWIEILEKIENGFKDYAMNKLDEGTLDIERWREAMALFAKWFTNFWD